MSEKVYRGIEIIPICWAVANYGKGRRKFVILLIDALFTSRKNAAKEICWCSKNPHEVREVSFVCYCRDSLQWVTSFTRFLDRTQRRKAVRRNPLDEWSARRTDLYLTTHKNHNGQTSIPTVGFKPSISAGERPQTYSLDRAATGTGRSFLYTSLMCNGCLLSRRVRVACGNVLQSSRT